VRNPYSLDRTACGSSAGSGAAVAAGLAAFAIGTETDGSVTCPAAINGVVGLKPTVGLVSRTHIVPISPEQDTAGPMTRTVTDAAIMLTAMAGRDKQDPATAEADKRRAKDYAKFLDADGLKGARLGLVMQFTTRPELKAYYQPFIETLRAAGATLVDVTFTPDYSKIADDRTNVLKYEFKTDLNKYLAGRTEDQTRSFISALGRRTVDRAAYIPAVADEFHYGGVLYLNAMTHTNIAELNREGVQKCCAVSAFGLRYVDAALNNAILKRPKAQPLPLTGDLARWSAREGPSMSSALGDLARALRARRWK